MSYDFLGDMFGGPEPPRPGKTSPPATEKGAQLRGRKVDGRFYVRAADVAELLDVNQVLPGIAAKLREADRGYKIRRLLCLKCGVETATDRRLDGCPSCGDTEGIPANLDDSVTVTLTAHELRILTMWASNYAQQHGFPQVARVITDRLSQQTDIALTLGQEVADLSAAPGVGRVRVLGDSPIAREMRGEAPGEGTQP